VRARSTTLYASVAGVVLRLAGHGERGEHDVEVGIDAVAQPV
jgi:hypothetical protein